MGVAFRAKLIGWLCAVCLSLTLVPTALAEMPTLSKGQTLYLPVYHRVYIDQIERDYDLSVTLVVRNTDLSNSITVYEGQHFDGAGLLKERFFKQPLVIPPLGSARRLIKKSGESPKLAAGPSFIIKWRSDKPVNPPLVQSVMVGIRSSLGVSFMTTAFPIVDKR